jgi:uncharacterized membrane protein
VILEISGTVYLERTSVAFLTCIPLLFLLFAAVLAKWTGMLAVITALVATVGLLGLQQYFNASTSDNNGRGEIFDVVAFLLIPTLQALIAIVGLICSLIDRFFKEKISGSGLSS